MTQLDDIALDYKTAPYTGWTREHLAALAERMLLAVKPFASPGHARITLPGAEGGYGRAVDGLEGFARTFLLAGFCLAGASDDPLGLAEWYAEGIADGTNPASPDRWVRCDEHDQAKVEAASLAIVLDMTRPLIWDRLGRGVQQHVIDYLSLVVGDETYPRNNWLWFRVCVETFLRSVGGPWNSTDIAADLTLHDSFRREGGWLADGDERAFDHYSGWALSLYPTLWQRMSGARELTDDTRRAADRAALDAYLCDACRLVGADGGPLMQGRSLIYRFAAAAPFWAGAMAEVPSLSPGLLRRAGCGIVKHFVDAGTLDDGRLTMGWFGPCRELAQNYSGPGSPYWASKGLLGLALPPDHPVWTAKEEPLPVEEGDFVGAMSAPGWAVSGTKSDGVVRVTNHGTDHANPGDLVGDSPLYAMIGYSTRTAPFVDDAAYRQPLAQYAALIDVDGALTHRAGFETIGCGVDDGVAWAASRQVAHWLDMPTDQIHHGSGYVGEPCPAGCLSVVSLLRGAWECRLVHVDQVEVGQAVSLRVAGWPVPSADATVDDDALVASATWGATVSAIQAVVASGLSAAMQVGADSVTSANPLGTPSRVPYLVFPATIGEWAVSLITLGEVDQPTTCRQVAVAAAADGWRIAVTWPDGLATSTVIKDSGMGCTQPVTASPDWRGDPRFETRAGQHR